MSPTRRTCAIVSCKARRSRTKSARHSGLLRGRRARAGAPGAAHHPDDPLARARACSAPSSRGRWRSKNTAACRSIFRCSIASAIAGMICAPISSPRWTVRSASTSSRTASRTGARNASPPTCGRIACPGPRTRTERSTSGSDVPRDGGQVPVHRPAARAALFAVEAAAQRSHGRQRRPQPDAARALRHQDRPQRPQQQQVRVRPGEVDPVPDHAAARPRADPPGLLPTGGADRRGVVR